MVLCVCNNVSDRRIAEAIEQGIRDEYRILEFLGLANECGRCAEFSLDAIRRELNSATCELVS